MTTFVLVHGSGGGGWIWKKVAPLLRSASHEVSTPTLTGCAERAHLNRADIGLETHILDVVGVLTFEDLFAIILVGHSYGGNVILQELLALPAHETQPERRRRWWPLQRKDRISMGAP